MVSTLSTFTAHTYGVYIVYAVLLTIPVALIWHGVRTIFEHWRWRAQVNDERRYGVELERWRRGG